MGDAVTITEPVAGWDVPLDGPSPPVLSPSEWRARNDSSLARKVAIIAAAACDPSGTAREGLPINRKQLRAWSDPGLRLWPWSGREVDDKGGRNKEAVVRLHDAWRALADANARREAEPRNPGLRKRLAAALEQRDALHAQLVRIMRERNGRGPVLEEDRH